RRGGARPGGRSRDPRQAAGAGVCELGLLKHPLDPARRVPQSLLRLSRPAGRDFHSMNTLGQDLRFALRTLLKSPGFAIVAVVCIAIGIGANTTIFSIFNAVLLRPFPYADPDRIVVVHETQPKNDVDRAGLSYLDYQDLREQSRSFSQIAAYTERSVTFSGTEEPERVIGASISGNLFPLLGVKPLLGRNYFREDEDRPG